MLPGFIRFGLMIAVEKPMPRLLQTLGQDRRDDRIGRERDYVLARRVARVKLEDEINLFDEHAHFEVDQTTVPRRLRDDLLQLLEARQDPGEELPPDSMRLSKTNQGARETDSVRQATVAPQHWLMRSDFVLLTCRLCGRDSGRG
jgi:hypothetical protein